MTRKLFFKSNKVVFCEGVFFYRQDNIDAITKSFKFRSYSIILTQYRLFEFLRINNFETKIVDGAYLDVCGILVQYMKGLILKKGINNREQELDIKELLYSVYKKLEKKTLCKIAGKQSGIKRIKTFTLGIILMRYSFFSFSMRTMLFLKKKIKFT